MADRRSLRPAGFDDLGLRRAIGERMLPLLVAAMTFLAALALAGAVGAAALARHWDEGAAAAVTVQVPQPESRASIADASRPGPARSDLARPDGSRLDRVVAILRATAGIASARPLSQTELADLLRPWLGSAEGGRLSLPLPGVVAVRLDAPVDLAGLRARLDAAAPGTLVEDHGVWAERLTMLARSLQACAALALLVVACVAAAVVTIATRAGLAARRDTIEIVHGLGATDGYIARRFARRATALAARGGIAGAVLALPVLLGLAQLAAPFAPEAASAVWGPRVPLWARVVADAALGLPLALWLALPALPLAAAGIGAATAQITVRRWLRRLP